MRRIKVSSLLLFNVEFSAHECQVEIFFSLCSMYNGIGVQTARGTGTSGHVMKNMSSLKTLRHDVSKLKQLREGETVLRQADPGILHHNELRRMEVLLAEIRNELEDEGLEEDEIDRIVNIKRDTLRNLNSIGKSRSLGDAHDSHTLSVGRSLRDAKFAEAMGITQIVDEVPVAVENVSDRLRSRSPRRGRGRRGGFSSSSSRERSK